eukprot:10462622-Heterocapsa_arctica.AAC.1
MCIKITEGGRRPKEPEKRRPKAERESAGLSGRPLAIAVGCLTKRKSFSTNYELNGVSGAYSIV